MQIVGVMDARNLQEELAKLRRQPFVDAALDPNLIDGVYLHCNQWCMYCPVTARCLAFKCRAPAKEPEETQDIFENTARRMYESLHFLKALTDAEGRHLPDLERLLSSDPRDHVKLPAVNDPLERMGRRYAVTSSRYLMSRSDYPFVMEPHADGPTPYEVFAWYHSLIAAKICRALLDSMAAARGQPECRADALASGKTALIALDESQAALQAMGREDSGARIDDMLAQLRRLGRELEGRCPEARTFVRRGLDEPADAETRC